MLALPMFSMLSHFAVELWEAPHPIPLPLGGRVTDAQPLWVRGIKHRSILDSLRGER